MFCRTANSSRYANTLIVSFRFTFNIVWLFIDTLAGFACSLSLFEAAPMWLNIISIQREFLLLESRVFAVQSSEKYIWWLRVKSNRLLVWFAIQHTNTSESNWPFEEKMLKQCLNFKLSVCSLQYCTDAYFCCRVFVCFLFVSIFVQDH